MNVLKASIGPRRQHGFSLLELTVTVVILGIVGILLARWLGTAAEERRVVASRDLLARADDALLVYAMLEERLPCPDTDNDGRQDRVDGNANAGCSAGAGVGRLPYVDLGLPDARAGRIRYGVLRRGDGDETLDADLTVRRNRLKPLYVAAALRKGYDSLSPSDSDQRILIDTQENGLDLCQAVRAGMRLNPDTAFVHTASGAGTARNVAYAVALPTTAEDIAAQAQAIADPGFASPREPSDPHRHGQVLAVGLDQLWTRMRCGDNVGPGTYAHYNIAAAAAITVISMEDYKAQLEIMKILAEANDKSANAAVVAGAAQVVTATAGTLDTAAESLDTYGAMTWRTALAATSVATAAAVEIAAAVFKSKATDAFASARNLYQEVDTPIGHARSLRADICKNAIAQDAKGIYLDAAPATPNDAICSL